MKDKTWQRGILALAIGFACFLAHVSSPDVSASADIGPKPSTTIEVVGITEYPIHITMLAKRDAGPFQLINIERFLLDYQSPTYLDDDVFMTFYQLGVQLDNDYYYVGYHQTLTFTKTALTWNYFPPDDFIVAIYLPESNQVIISNEVYEHINFHTYYRLTLQLDELMHVESNLYAFLDSHFIYISHISNEILYFILRLFLTLGIELFLAYLFLYRDKYTFFTILFTNLVTLIVLNVVLSILLFYFGSWTFFTYLILGEILVFIVEAAVYRLRFTQLWRQGKISKVGLPIVYALVANLVTALLTFFVH